jgi:putative mRNA 3-end processing factor
MAMRDQGPVDRALITHGHSDHARAGHRAVLATEETLDIMRLRLGEAFCESSQIAVLGQAQRIGDVTVTFFPAGHVLGSAQILIEAGGTRIVLSGDYKRQADPTCQPFEIIPCDVFITEATFGLPIFRHPYTLQEARKVLDSVALFPDRAHLIGAYSLGKAQRMMRALADAGLDRPIHLHGAMEKITDYYQSRQIRLAETMRVAGASKADLKGAIVLCPPGSLNDLWSRRFPDPVTAFASGWMRTRARARQRGVELPLVVSDHADWADLCRTIEETGASEVWVTHGQEDALVHWCGKRGLKAKPLNLIGYGDEGEDENKAASSLMVSTDLPSSALLIPRGDTQAQNLDSRQPFRPNQA